MLKLILGVVIGFVVVTTLYIAGINVVDRVYYGNYIIVEQRVGSHVSGIEVCDECLIITFDEGCNRRSTYWFKKQHELDNRLSEGMAVDLFFDGRYIKHIAPRQKYKNKC